MLVRFIADWPPYKGGQHVEIPDRIGSHFVARAMAQVVTAGDMQEYLRTMRVIDRAVEKGIGKMPAIAGRRVITETQWRHELGKDQPGYAAAAAKYRRFLKELQT